MHSGHPTRPANALGLQLQNVIAFPKQPERAAEGGCGGCGQAPRDNVSLLRLWDRAGQRDGLDGVSEALIERLRELGERERPAAIRRGLCESAQC